MTTRKSFSAARPEAETIEFDVDGEVFLAAVAADLPGAALLDLSALEATRKPMEQLRLIADFLDAALLPESRDRFAARLRDAGNPITLAAATDVAVWLIEEIYTGHPTEPSSAPVAGSSTSGRGSTAGARRKASTR